VSPTSHGALHKVANESGTRYETTSIRPDLAEARHYDRKLAQGEFGILRPQGRPKPSHEAWLQEPERALDPDAPEGQRLDFNDPALGEVLREAARKGEVYVRIECLDYSLEGQGAIRTNPNETWRLRPVRVPVIPPIHRTDRDDKDERP
jgi:hypothetical protein